MKCSLGISNFLEEISSLSQSVVFLYFFALIAEEGFLISTCYSLEFWIQMLISFLFSLAFLLLFLCKSRKSRNTWSNRQIWPWNAEWSRAKTSRVLPRKCTGHSKHPFPTTQEKTLHMDITRWSTPNSDCLYYLQPKMEKVYTVNKNKSRSWLWLRSWTPYYQIQTQIEESRENR